MVKVTLHRADRILIAIGKAVKAAEPKPNLKISVFSPDVAVAISDTVKETARRLDVVARLYEIRASIRTEVAKANSAAGVVEILQKKYAYEDTIKALEKLPGVAAVVASDESADDYSLSRRRRRGSAAPDVVDINAAEALANAARERFQTADSAASDLEFGALDRATSDKLKKRVVELRRETDKCFDELAARNSATTVEIPKSDMDWLISNNVI